jgi:hypothetical protein
MRRTRGNAPGGFQGRAKSDRAPGMYAATPLQQWRDAHGPRLHGPGLGRADRVWTTAAPATMTWWRVSSLRLTRCRQAPSMTPVAIGHPRSGRGRATLEKRRHSPRSQAHLMRVARPTSGPSEQRVSRQLAAQQHVEGPRRRPERCGRVGRHHGRRRAVMIQVRASKRTPLSVSWAARSARNWSRARPLSPRSRAVNISLVSRRPRTKS